MPEHNIIVAFNQIVQQLEKMRDAFIKDLDENPDTYEGITIDDAYIWFIEGLN